MARTENRARDAARSAAEKIAAALGYAVEQGHLASNPVDRIQWTTPAVAASVDRQVVVSPAQARSLLAAVRALPGPRDRPSGMVSPVSARPGFCTVFMSKRVYASATTT